MAELEDRDLAIVEMSLRAIDPAERRALKEIHVDGIQRLTVERRDLVWRLNGVDRALAMRRYALEILNREEPT